MADTIELRGLRALGICGALPEEQVRAQPLEIDLDVSADLAAACISDDLADTIDYGALCGLIERVVTTESFALLERLAERLAEVVMADDRVLGVVVSVRKLRPPVAQQLDTSGVRIHRLRADAG